MFTRPHRPDRSVASVAHQNGQRTLFRGKPVARQWRWTFMRTCCKVSRKAPP